MYAYNFFKWRMSREFFPKADLLVKANVYNIGQSLSSLKSPKKSPKKKHNVHGIEGVIHDNTIGS